jgi:hypothetical protein
MDMETGIIKSAISTAPILALKPSNMLKPPAIASKPEKGTTREANLMPCVAAYCMVPAEKWENPERIKMNENNTLAAMVAYFIIVIFNINECTFELKFNQV